MVEYEAIAHLARPVRVDHDSVDLEFVSDCGQLCRVVTVAREAQGEEGTGRLSRAIRTTLQRIIGENPADSTLPALELEQLICKGFEKVRPYLSRRGDQWVRSNKEKNPGEFFDQQLRANPIVEAYDIDVLVRVLIEVSRSDSELRREERAFLEEIVQDEETIKRLSKAPNITVAELAETSSVQVKETILMLAWAMAYADGHLDVEEMTRLNQLCRGFTLPADRVRELQMAAKLFLLDRHFQSSKKELSLEQLRESFDKKAQEWALDDSQLQTLRNWYPNELR